jgi:hypothetical protein
VVPRKRGAACETYLLNAFLSHTLADVALSDLTKSRVTGYCVERLKRVKTGTVNRELDVLGHAFEVARHSWDVHHSALRCCYSGLALSEHTNSMADRIIPVTEKATKMVWKRGGLADLRFHDRRHEAVSRSLFGVRFVPIATICGCDSCYWNETPSLLPCAQLTRQCLTSVSPSIANKKTCGTPKVLNSVMPAPCDVRSVTIHGTSCPAAPNLTAAFLFWGTRASFRRSRMIGTSIWQSSRMTTSVNKRPSAIESKIEHRLRYPFAKQLCTVESLCHL